MKKATPFMNNKSILCGVCLESVDFRLNFYLILLSEYVLVHVFSSITEISLCYILETKTGEGRIAVVCMQPVAVVHCLKTALFENNILCLSVERISEFLSLAFDSEKSSVWFEFQMP